MARNYVDNARSAIDLTNLGIEKTELVKTVLTSMIQLGTSPGVKGLQVQIDKERAESVAAKLHFEVLCFASYWTSTLIVNYATTNSFFRKDVDLDGAQTFYKSIRTNLKKFCELNEFNTFFDLGVTKIDPEITVGPTEPLRSEKRLDQYEKIASKGSNMDTIKWYGKHLAMTFALADYPLFEPLALTFAEPTINIADIVMKEVFADN